jgi:hypothetical protein
MASTPAGTFCSVYIASTGNAASDRTPVGGGTYREALNVCAADLSFQQRVEDGKSHHGYANPEDRPSDPERDGSADNRKRGADSRNAEQGQSICRIHLHSNHLTPPIIVARKEGRIGGPGFRHSSRYHHFGREPTWLAAAMPLCERRGSLWADNP